jgi:hypothetical protein
LLVGIGQALFLPFTLNVVVRTAAQIRDNLGGSRLAAMP